MLLLKDKYLLHKEEDFYFNKDAKKKIDWLFKKENKNKIPNIIINGDKGSGKKAIATYIYFTLYDKNLKLQLKNQKASNNSIFYYKISPECLWLNCNFFDKVMFNIIYNFAESLSFNQSEENTVKLIIFDNFNNLPYIVQMELRRIFENYNQYCKFILLCNGLEMIMKPIISRCSEIKINKPNDEELYAYLKFIGTEELKDKTNDDKIHLNKENINNIIKISNNKISTALFLLENFLNNINIGKGFSSIIDKIIEHIKESNSNFYIIRDSIKKLINNDNDIYEIIKCITDKLLKNNKTRKFNENEVNKINKITEKTIKSLKKTNNNILYIDIYIHKILFIYYKIY
jgi:DNA polymerase III delta prime subunit